MAQAETSRGVKREHGGVRDVDSSLSLMAKAQLNENSSNKNMSHQLAMQKLSEDAGQISNPFS